jgi:hypothetical protein
VIAQWGCCRSASCKCVRAQPRPVLRGWGFRLAEQRHQLRTLSNVDPITLAVITLTRDRAPAHEIAVFADTGDAGAIPAGNGPVMSDCPVIGEAELVPKVQVDYGHTVIARLSSKDTELSVAVPVLHWVAGELEVGAQHKPDKQLNCHAVIPLEFFSHDRLRPK